MITGVVNKNLEATIRVKIWGANGLSDEVTTVIDTGYNGVITLPLAIVTALALPTAASHEVTLGDAANATFQYYYANIEWDGQKQNIRVLCVEVAPLVGTKLLAGHKMDADFVPNGQVRLSILP